MQLAIANHTVLTVLQIEVVVGAQNTTAVAPKNLSERITLVVLLAFIFKP